MTFSTGDERRNKVIKKIVCCKKILLLDNKVLEWVSGSASHFGHETSYELTHFKKLVRVSITKSLLFCLRHDPLIVTSHNFYFHENNVT